MLPKEYSKYFCDKISDRGKLSLVEKVAAFAVKDPRTVSIGSGKRLVSVLLLDDDAVSQYMVEITGIRPDDKKFRISSAIRHEHSLAEFWKQEQNAKFRTCKGLFFCREGKYLKFDDSVFGDYVPDSFLLSLGKSVNYIQSKEAVAVYVLDLPGSRGYSKDLAFLYWLQTKFPEVVPVTEQALKGETLNSVASRMIIPSELNNIKLRVSPSIRLNELLLDNQSDAPVISIPITDQVLDSECVAGVLWREIVPGGIKPDLTVGGIPIVLLTARADTDGYQNIFLSISTPGGAGRTLWRNVVHNALGACVSSCK